MAGTAGRWALLIIAVCCGRLTTSKTAESLCPKPAVPEDAILAKLHSSINLTCTGCEGRVFWGRQSLQVTRRPHDVTESVHLVMKSVAYEDEDNYTCYKDGAPVCSVQLIVKDERQDDTSLSCYHQHPTHNITCEWKPTKLLHPLSTATLIKVRVLEDPIFYPCTYNRSKERFTCSSLYNEGDSRRHVFYLCVSGRTDSQLTGNLEAYVKDLLHVGAPLSVRVTPIRNHPRKLRVSWSQPEFWETPFYELEYQVLYRAENSLHHSNGTTAEASFVIDDAVMGRKHLIRVRAREEYQENWGSWSAEAVGVPWTDGAKTTLVPSEYDPLTSQEEEDPKNEAKTTLVPSEYDPLTSQEEEDPKSREEFPKSPPPVPRYTWIAPCLSLGVVFFIFLALWIRYQEIKILKLKWSFLRSLFHASSKDSRMQPPVSESLLVSSPSSVAVSVPPLLDAE